MIIIISYIFIICYSYSIKLIDIIYISFITDSYEGGENKNIEKIIKILIIKNKKS